MNSFLSFVLVILITGCWLVFVSYADYLVAKQQRNLGKLGQGWQVGLSLKRLLNLPWEWPQWIISGVVVLVISAVLSIPGPLFLLIVTLMGFMVLAVMLWADILLVKQGDAALDGWRPREPAHPSRPPSAQLYGVHGEYKGKILDCGRETLIGRSRRCHICLIKPQVSGRHARIVYAGGNWFIQDQNSKAGTFVNGMLVTAIQLHHGNKIRICNTEFEFRIK